MAPFLAADAATETDDRKNSLTAIFYCFYRRKSSYNFLWVFIKTDKKLLFQGFSRISIYSIIAPHKFIL